MVFPNKLAGLTDSVWVGIFGVSPKKRGTVVIFFQKSMFSRLRPKTEKNWLSILLAFLAPVFGF